jgi:hypothetical protein
MDRSLLLACNCMIPCALARFSPGRLQAEGQSPLRHICALVSQSGLPGARSRSVPRESLTPVFQRGPGRTIENPARLRGGLNAAARWSDFRATRILECKRNAGCGGMHWRDCRAELRRAARPSLIGREEFLCLALLGAICFQAERRLRLLLWRLVRRGGVRLL